MQEKDNDFLVESQGLPFPDYCYVDHAIGHVSHRTCPIPISQLEKGLANIGKQAAFRTIGRFRNDYLEYYQTHRNEKGQNTVGGYRGEMFADYLVFDIDYEKDVAVAHSWARELVQYLNAEYGVGFESQAYFFSGKKGFHVLAPEKLFGGFEPSSELPMILKMMAMRLCDPKKLDSSIYETNRLFRVANTYHEMSGLYKVQLDPRMFLHGSVGEICEFAKQKQKTFKCWEIAPIDGLVNLYRECVNQINKGNGTTSVSVTTDVTGAAQIPAGKKPCIIRILSNGSTKGMRHECALRLADYFRKEGYPQDMTLALLLQWMNRCEIKNDAGELKSDFAHVVSDVYSKAYDYGCNDPILKQFCRDGKDCLHSAEQQSVFIDAPSPDDLELNVIVDDFAVEGAITLLAGKSQGMKSLYSQWLLNSQGVPTLYIVDFDLSSFLFHVRQRQMEGQSVIPIILNPNSKVDPSFKSSAFWEGLEKKVFETSAKVVVFDTLLDFVDGDFSRAGDLNFSMQQCRRFAVKMNIAIVLITHTVKISWNHENLTLSDVADSRVVTTKSDLVLGFQVNTDNMQRTLLQVSMLKNRLGPQSEPVVFKVSTPKTHPSGIFEFEATEEKFPSLESRSVSAAVQNAITDLRDFLETKKGKSLVTDAEEYMKYCGHSKKVTRMARERICITKKDGDKWYWELKNEG